MLSCTVCWWRQAGRGSEVGVLLVHPSLADHMLVSVAIPSTGQDMLGVVEFGPAGWMT